jgi:chitin-binding protein
MTIYRTLAAVAAIGIAQLLGAALTAGPAAAHGALDNPVSRAAACAAGSPQATTAACQAVVEARGATSFGDWDNVRVAGVGGRDRELIPDGRLCSGGVAAYGGLDLARPDWPTTSVSAGASFTFTYRETIPHKGTFRLYVTKDGYQAGQRLSWSDLEAEPFLTATDPTHRDQKYVMEGKLPAGKSGPHLIYTIWQNSDTPDTYYSCSDVVFAGTPGGDPTPEPAQPSADQTPAAKSPASQAPAATPPASAAAPSKASSSSRLSSTGGRSYLLPVSAAITMLLLTVVGAFVYRQRRPSRPSRGRHH